FEQRQLQKAGELRWLLSALALSVAFGGCSPNPSADDIAEKDGGGGSSTVAPDQVTTEDGTLVDCASLQRPPTPLRRLTQFEYNNTVQDLLGTALTPSDA